MNTIAQHVSNEVAANQTVVNASAEAKLNIGQWVETGVRPRDLMPKFPGKVDGWKAEK